MKWLIRILAGLVVLLVLGYVAVLGCIYVNQRSLQYLGLDEPLLKLGDTKLKNAALVEIATADGSRIKGWYEAPQPGKPLILYYRGNWGSFSREHQRYEAMEADGYGFLAFDYRGFGESPGTISQTHILEDGLAAFDWAAAKGFRLVIWGRSLGSGPATYAASQRDVDALYLETPFDSATAVAKDRYAYLPIDFLMQDQYPVYQWILNVTEPVFVSHGDADTTIGVQHGRHVYELAPNKAGEWIVPGADHDDLWAAGEWEKAKGFFEGVEQG